MKAQFQKVQSGHYYSFHTHRAINAHVDVSWHYHAEMEITFIKQGRGTRYIGNSVAHFEPGELVLIGPNVPHSWKNDDEYYHENDGLKHEDWVIQFDKEFWGKHFLELPEMSIIKDLFDEAERGVVFHFDKHTHEEVVGLLDKLYSAEAYLRLEILIQILGKMAYASQREFLNSSSITKTSTEDREKMLKIHHFVTNHFQDGIKLEDAALISGMSASGFCRQFKRINNKTFIEYVNEVRIEHACHLLREKAMSVTASCYESGFNNFSNFSKQFKKVTGVSPNQYRKKFK